MKYLTCEVPESVAYIIPIGDVHIGDKAFKGEGERKLREYIVKKDESLSGFQDYTVPTDELYIENFLLYIYSTPSTPYQKLFSKFDTGFS